MKFDMPKAVFCGLALIAAAIFFGPGSVPATAQGDKKPIRVKICDDYGFCAQITKRLEPGPNGEPMSYHLNVQQVSDRDMNQ